MASDPVQASLQKCLSLLAQESRDLGCSEISYRDSPPTPLEFLRLVMANKPCVFGNVGKDWPALQKWRRREYFETTFQQQKITVSVTPNGLADCVINDKFCLPYEEQMTFPELLDRFPESQAPDSDENYDHNEPVHYVQSQNNNFSTEFSVLLDDVPKDIAFASEALGKQPDAVNFWLGSDRSVTSLHKDHYENLYMVITGSKTFTLIPPTEGFCLPEKRYTTASYHPSDDSPTRTTKWAIVPTEPPSTTPWIALDPLHPDPAVHGDYIKHSQPIQVTLLPGQMLYLPSLWYHHVQQGLERLDGFAATIAVNWWYDMDFGRPYVYYGFSKQIGLIARGDLTELQEQLAETEPEEDPID
ncbi:jmjC domain-containing protein 7 [Polychytrium aggregatum]|uniref:jmjC domain-containing protein 7 n=1 Tax=Polychytrium aggregatum TaxID=110093 RepID=UPI0022FE97D0|nr:jmjC domain-containing protein 7 [Polychytrium aggregatum]XP_052966982.1 jmjC domain-containing protein 7 [Polychytrium aggregatum]KAI9190786.1 jmjC domain-containing protein 7 [Polychytrium aggregatum]KAI9204902.1 jmjC domain-containing protein 7 [Polychytrium aggregatum]